MCATCGCSSSTIPINDDRPRDGRIAYRRITAPPSGPMRLNAHKHSEGVHDTPRAPSHEPGATVAIEQAVLAKNDRIAQRNRTRLEGLGILALNIVGAPGTGKTSLLERTLADLRGELDIAVIEGDQATQHDAQRIRAAGGRAVQINTGAGCHLDAEMVAGGLASLAPAAGSVVMIENVGNLVCPALFDLGESARIVVLSTTEGDDKPLKYPHMFRSSQLLLLNKIDLLAHVRFDVDRCIDWARRVNPAIAVIRVSATTGDGMDAWYGWLRGLRVSNRVAATPQRAVS